MFECESCSKKFQHQSAAHQHMRDKVHYKKQNEDMDQNEPPRCLDWVFTESSNVHVAKDRGWFTEYTPFETEVGDHYGTPPSRVIGIGTVELLTEPSPFSQGLILPRPLRLTNVLHAPSVVCNVIGIPIMHDYNVSTNFAGRVTKGHITDKEGQLIAYFDPSRDLLQIKLRNPPAGTYPLMRGGLYLINARWSDTERAKWDARQNNIQGPLNKEEKTWLKEHFGNEFRFLREYGFSIYKEEDREDGRALLRTIMREDKE